MRSTTILFALALLVSSACSSETGILVEVRASADFDASAIDHIRFYVGEDTVADPMRFADNQPLNDINMIGHNLSERPYSLLVRPRGEENARVVVGVLAYDSEGDAVGVAYIPEPVGFVSGVVTKWELEISPLDSSSSTQGDCLKWMVGDQWLYIGREGDADCDGVSPPDDCDDNDHRVGPNRRERCGNGIDDNCDTRIDPVEDLDEDGFYTCADEQRDCDDENPRVNPGIEGDECNGLDDNCNGMCDEGADGDGDLVTHCGSFLNESGSCYDYNPELFDCKDNNPDVFPGNVEIPNGIDDNCSLVCDDDPALDGDMDGFTLWGRFGVCSESMAEQGGFDCNPDLGSIAPGTQEFCDGTDSDCDLDEIEESPCFVQSGSGCQQGVRICQAGQLENGCALVNDGLDPLPNAICTAYTTCENNGVADPYECVIQGLSMVPVTNHSCETQTTVGNTCPGGESVIQLAGVSGNCTYQIIGGSEQQGYTVELIPAGGGDPDVFVNGCGALLSVEAGEGAGYATIYINVTSDVATKMMEIVLSNSVHSDCDGQGLLCTW